MQVYIPTAKALPSPGQQLALCCLSHAPLHGKHVCVQQQQEPGEERLQGGREDQEAHGLQQPAAAAKQAAHGSA